MRAIMFGIIACLWVNGVAHCSQNVEIWTYDTLPPLAFTNRHGELTGVYIEIVKLAVSRMPGYTVSFKVGPWARVKKAAEKGKAFAILPPYFHAHDWLTDSEPRRPYIWPYSLPLFTQKDVVVCNERALSEPRREFPDDYKGLRFVMWRGDGRAGEEFIDMAQQGAIAVEMVNDIKGTIPFLLMERADCTVVSKIPYHWYVKQMKTTGEYQKYDRKEVVLKEVAVVSENDGYLGYSDIDAEKNFPFKKDFAIKFDIEIYKMRKSGEIQAIVDSFIE